MCQNPTIRERPSLWQNSNFASFYHTMMAMLKENNIAVEVGCPKNKKMYKNQSNPIAKKRRKYWL